MNYDRIIQDALRLARSPRRFALGGEAKKSGSREENFRNWFGNSKAIDGEGKPWVHYHATAKDFSQFIPGGYDPSLSGPAIWLTPHKHSQSAGHNIMSGRGQFKEGANVKPLYVKIEKPLHVDESDPEGKEELRKKFGAKSYGWPMTIHPEDVKKMKEAGYDGIFHLTHRDAETGASKPFNRETGEGLETIVFDPYQVKSAIGNIGEFNPKSHDITKSHGGMAGYASGGDVDQPRKLDDMGFYSSAAESARSLPQSKGTPQQMLATMKGVKPAELEWSGVQDKFAGQKSVTKDDLAQHFEQNVPQIKETVLGGKSRKQIDLEVNKIEDIYLPKIQQHEDIINNYIYAKNHGFENTLTQEDHNRYNSSVVEYERLSNELNKETDKIISNSGGGYTRHDGYTVGNSLKYGTPEERNYREVLLRLAGEHKYQPPEEHWDEDNVIAHLRMQDRGPNNNILHLEELQSDWAQQGREEGFDTKDMKEKREFARNEFGNHQKYLWDKYGFSPGLNIERYAKLMNIPDDEVSKYKNLKNEVSRLGGFDDDRIESAPYVTNTDHWVELGLKRALLEAARGGYDKLVWTPGEEQAKRYDLSRHVAKILYNPEQKRLEYIKVGDRYEIPNEHPERVLPEELPRVIGREAADKLLATNKDKYGTHSLGGLDLKFGGEGMKSFYDKMLPSALRRVLKPHTDKIQPTSHVVKGNDGEDVTLPGIEITPKLRESILKRGFSYYARGGEVRQHFEDGGDAEGGSPAGDTGGFMGDTTGKDTAPAPSNVGYSAEDENAPPPNVTQQNSYSHFEGVPVLESVEKSITTGPGLVGAIAPQPFGALATIAEAINNAYYGGTARADIDPNAGGAGTSEQPQFQQTPIYDVQQNPVVGKALDVTAPKEQFTINESLTKPSIVEAPVAAPAPAPTPQPFPTAAPELEEPAPILPEPQPTPALATVPPVVYHSDRDDIGSGLPFPKADEEDPQKLIQAFSVGKPKLPPMMARGGVPRNSHPALSIPGVHIREEIHGRPIFLGERDG